jgi:hypothetical protein
MTDLRPSLPPALSRRYAYHAGVYESHARRVEQVILRSSSAVRAPADRARDAAARLPDLPTTALVNAALAPFGLSFVVVDSGYSNGGRARSAAVALVDSATREVAARGVGSDTFDAYQNLRAGLGWTRPKYTTAPAVVVGTVLEDGE